jgi:2-hydroxychromene-2-carboxylate isomerase
VPFAFNPHFPINTLTLMRGACGMQLRHPEALARYIDAVFHALWVKPCNMGDPQVLAQVLGQAGFEAQEFMDLIGDPQVKAQLISNPAEAVARGVFGAPSMFVGDHLFFGQDRLDFVRHALA